MNALRPLWLALAFLTRLPVPPLGHVSARELGASLPWFPAVGLILGAALAPPRPRAGAAPGRRRLGIDPVGGTQR